MTVVPEVVSLHRYPVKSMGGEEVPRLELDHRGCVDDRRWSVRTAAGKIGSGKDTRRFAVVPGLLELRASQREDGRVVISLPDGTTYAVDDERAPERLSRFLGQPVTLAAETDVSHFDDGPVSLLATASLDTVAVERGQPVAADRFRANIVLATGTAFVEETWVGREVAIGTAVLRVDLASPRCVMVDMATAELPAQHGNLAAVGRANEACLGVVATVVVPGTVAVGDVVTVR
ncbi:MAG: MOSC domain-containing protein [Actinobacteria bacterium]|nr:MOSC domain-containing protein [Actinomycetota bacterium]